MAVPVLQVHPTRRCNLRCLHCYSSSGPDERGELPVEMIAQLVDDAFAEGYCTLSMSGGEPLLYEPLPRLLAHAHAAGMSTTVTTNGTLLRPRYLEPISPHLDLLAISLDGVPASHNRMRASPRAFALLNTGLAEVKRLGLALGFIFTLTQHNVHELPWVAAFARQSGARLLQIHPLELVGRARVDLPASRPDLLERSYAWLTALSLQARAGHAMRVQLDLASVQLLAAQPQLADSPVSADAWARRPLAELCSPLVLEPDGVIVPLTYGFPRELAIGDLTTERLPAAADRWRRNPQPYLAHWRAAYQRAQRDGALVNWYEVLSETTPPQS